MARSYPANTQIQKFLEESYNKERDARLGWYVRNLSGSDASRGSKQVEVFRKKIADAAPKPAAGLASLDNFVPKRYNKRIIKYDDHLVKLAQRSSARDSQLLSEMHPVHRRTREKLYDGFTKEGKGRYQYLQDRYQTIPERKYQFPQCSSWEYGWKLSDVIKKENIRKPEYGRTKIVADTFYTRTGIPSLRCAMTH